ncbi:MAG: MATE family efflux transporter [Acidobacteria bacterium]|nr:MAG: MATE family efflux transporter [Acidobacteriota bacterium]
MEPPSRSTPGFWHELRQTVRGVPKDFTSGSIGRAIALLAIPMVLEMVMQSVFALVDTFFVGRLGADAVAVVGLGDSLLTLVFALALGLAMGTTAMVARRIGEKDPAAAATAAGQALLVGTVLAVATGLLGAATAPSLLRLMGASDGVVAVGSSYVAVLLGGNVTVFFLFLINAIFRGAGDPMLAMKALWLANLINIVLDPLLIFGWGPIPALGVTGAAVATTIGRGIGVLYQLYVLASAQGRFTLGLKHLRPAPAAMRRLLRISATGMLQLLVATASWVLVIRIVALFGSVALAGYAIAVRILIFALLPSWGMGNAAATLVGQNLGAGKPERAVRSVWITAHTNMVFLLATSVVLIAFAETFIGYFSRDPAVIAVGVDCLRIVSYSYVFFAYGMVTVQAFNGAGDTTTPAWVNFGCYWLLELPLAYLLGVTSGFGPRGIFAAIAIAQAVLAISGILLFRRGRWQRQVV